MEPLTNAIPHQEITDVDEGIHMGKSQNMGKSLHDLIYQHLKFEAPLFFDIPLFKTLMSTLKSPDNLFI